jgi:hypothetical protein
MEEYLTENNFNEKKDKENEKNKKFPDHNFPPQQIHEKKISN